MGEIKSRENLSTRGGSFGIALKEIMNKKEIPKKFKSLIQKASNIFKGSELKGNKKDFIQCSLA